MTDARNTTESRTNTEPTTPEPSPSTGWRETAVAMHAPRAHAVEPVDEQTPPPERLADERAPADPEVTVFS